jgi:hypothetical protein
VKSLRSRNVPKSCEIRPNYQRAFWGSPFLSSNPGTPATQSRLHAELPFVRNVCDVFVCYRGKVGLQRVKLALTASLLPRFDAMSPTANFQYPKSVHRDSVRTWWRPVWHVRYRPDCVAKLFSGARANFSRGAGALAPKLCRGSLEQSDFQPAIFVGLLQGIVSAKICFDGHPAKFSGHLIFEFCNTIGRKADMGGVSFNIR